MKKKEIIANCENFLDEIKFTEYLVKNPALSCSKVAVEDLRMNIDGVAYLFEEFVEEIRGGA